ncbi:MAG: ABC transporter permease [Clostridia bacterium]|nr:ABC transporter permease [Clostridia bacterium]
MKKKLYGLGFGAFLILLWQLLAVKINASYILPSPLQVWQALQKNFGVIMTKHFPITMEVVLIGSGIALVLGISLAILMDLDERIEKAVYPILTVSQTIPVLCIAPIFVLWFGYTTTTRVIVVVLLTFFSITVNVFDGFKATKQEMTELMATYGATPMQQFMKLRLPTALPYFFTALKISIPWAVVGSAIAEWLGAPGGLGNYSRKMMMDLNAAGLIAPLLVISAVALLINMLIRLIERLVVTWRAEV